MNAREHLDESLDGFYNGMPYDEIKDHVEAALALLANRWAAFTDDELAGLDDCFQHYTVDAVHALIYEVEAELERRKDTPSAP